MRSSLWGRIMCCTMSVRPSVRPSHASDFLEKGKPNHFVGYKTMLLPVALSAYFHCFDLSHCTGRARKVTPRKKFGISEIVVIFPPNLQYLQRRIQAVFELKCIFFNVNKLIKLQL